jgi:hypothetical protein
MTLLAKLGVSLPERYYLGLDVGYREHVGVVIPLEVFAEGGDRWKRVRCLHFASTSAGLAKFQAYLDRHSQDARQFLGLCEPTGGCYGATVYQHLLSRGYAMWMVENTATRDMRLKLMPNLPKTDEIEARVMARMGYLHEAVGEEFTLRLLKLASPDDAELLALCRDQWKLNSMICRARNQFAQMMAVIFPELKTFFTDSVSRPVPVALIAAYPTPADLAAASAEEVRAVLRKARGYRHVERVAELQDLALHSSGLLPDPGRAWRLKWLTEFILTNSAHLKDLEQRIELSLEKRETYSLLSDIPYSGPASLGVILAVTGDVSRFSNYRQYVAYTGYYAGLETSQTIDRTRMSRRGNRTMKRALFQIVAPLVWFDPTDNPYKQLYERKRAEGRPWYKAMPFACAALARHIYHCLKSGERYDVEKVFKRPQLALASEPAPMDLMATLDERFEAMDAHLTQLEG